MKLCKYFHVGLHLFEIFRCRIKILFLPYISYRNQIVCTTALYNSDYCHYSESIFPTLELQNNSNALFVLEFSGARDQARNFDIDVSYRKCVHHFLSVQLVLLRVLAVVLLQSQNSLPVGGTAYCIIQSLCTYLTFLAPLKFG